MVSPSMATEETGMETSSVTEKAVDDEAAAAAAAFGLDGGGGGGSFSTMGTAAAMGTSPEVADDVLRLVPQLGQKLDPLGMESDPHALQTSNVSVMVRCNDF